ncbi:unnamed protein product, partial [Prorocentrum cordatum]
MVDVPSQHSLPILFSYLMRWFWEITDDVCRACGITERPNSCNVNLYEDGSQAVGWHADDESLFDATRRDSLIMSLSLGAARTFELYPNDDPDDIHQILLKDGDLCTMEGLLQKHYKHRVPFERSARGPRINLTWRWIVRHESGCPAAGSRAQAVPALGYRARRPARAPAADPEERTAATSAQLGRAPRGPAQ